MKTFWRNGARGDEGQALVEFALVVPILLLLVVGVFEFAAAWRGYQVVTDAARETARVAVSDGDETWATEDSLRMIAKGALARGGLDPSLVPANGITITGCGNCTNNPGAVSSTVDITYPYGFAVLGKLMGVPPVTLKTSFVMRNQY